MRYFYLILGFSIFVFYQCNIPKVLDEEGEILALGNELNGTSWEVSNIIRDGQEIVLDSFTLVFTDLERGQTSRPNFNRSMFYKIEVLKTNSSYGRFINIFLFSGGGSREIYEVLELTDQTMILHTSFINQLDVVDFCILKLNKTER